MRFISLDEYASLPLSESSEKRLNQLPAHVWSPQVFREKAYELKQKANIEVRMVLSADQLPELGNINEHKYDCSFIDCRDRLRGGENLYIALAMRHASIIGFGIAGHKEDSLVEIEIIDVARSSQRSSGLEVSLILESQNFTVGVAHLLVDQISSHYQGILQVDATHSTSRYVFKSLGFVQQPNESNPCRLWRPPIAN